MKPNYLRTQPGAFRFYYPGGAPNLGSVGGNSTPDVITICEPNEEVANTYAVYSRLKGPISLEFEIEICALATKLLTPEVIFATISSGIVCDMTVDLLFDSLKLVDDPKHNRLTPIDILHALTETHEPGKRIRPAVKCIDVPCDVAAAIERLTPQCLIVNWVRREGGIRDLLLVLYTLYVGKIGK